MQRAANRGAAQALTGWVVLPPDIDEVAIGRAQDGIIVVTVIDLPAPVQAAASHL